LAAAGFDGERELFRGAGFGSFERHVLGEMRESGRDVSSFITRADRDINRERGAFGFRQMGMGKAGAAGEGVAGVSGWHAGNLNAGFQI